MSDPYWYSYLAGLIDGEGCFLVHTHANKKSKLGYSWQVSLTITQADYPFLQSIRETLGYGQVVFSRAHFINFSANHCRELIPKILPFLKIKKDQAELVLEALTYTKMRHRKQRMEYCDRKLHEIDRKLKALHTH